MFSQNFQIPTNEPKKSIQNNPRHHRKKFFKNKRKGNKRKTNSKKQVAQPTFSTITMSSWAESFTQAATWQLKQQIAFWKSKARALEYENNILHDIVRRNYVSGSLPASSDTEEPDLEFEKYDGEDELVVSEEFIRFLQENAKYKEDARRERERLKELQNREKNETERMEGTPTNNCTASIEKELRSLYGESWERISALETSILSQFINNCDQVKPDYWPCVALNY